MHSIAFTAPLLPGKSATAREAMHSCMQGERKAAYDASRQRLGIARESVWIQQTPGGDFAIVYLEADDLQAVFGGLATSQVPFDHWFREHAREIHGIDLEQGFPPPEQTVNYRRADVASSPEPEAWPPPEAKPTTGNVPVRRTSVWGRVADFVTRVVLTTVHPAPG